MNAEQLMFEFAPKPAELKPVRSVGIPRVRELSDSHSNRKTRESCLRQYYLQVFQAYAGGFPGASREQRYARYLRYLGSPYGLLGNAVHEFAEAYYFSKLDRKFGVRTGLRPVPTRLLRLFATHNFQQAWLASSNLTLQEYLRCSNPKRARFFKEHASGYFGPHNNSEKLRAFREKLKRCLDAVEYDLEELVLKPFVEEHGDWEVVAIEGKHIDRGRIIRPRGDTRSEQSLRLSSEPPSFPIPVKPYLVKFFAVVDLVFHFPKTGLKLLVDLKTGRARDQNEVQIRRYGGLFAKFHRRHFRWDKMEMILFHLEQDLSEGGEERRKAQRVQRISFASAGECRDAYQEIVRSCEEYVRLLTPVEEVSREQLRTLIGTDAVEEGGKLIALPERFPPTAAESYDAVTCLMCPYRLRLPDGTTLCPEGARIAEGDLRRQGTPSKPAPIRL